MKRNCFRALSFIATLLSFSALAAEKLPVEHFARLPDFRAATLSPDGNMIAGLVTLQGHEVVVTKDLQTNEFHLVAKASEGEASFRGLQWGNTERLLLSYDFPSARFGIETVETRMISILYDGSDRQGMFRERSSDHRVPQIQDRVIDLLPDDEEHILMAFAVNRNADVGLFKVDIESGRRKTLKGGYTDSVHWITDQQGRPRIYQKFKETTHEFVLLTLEGKKDRTLWEFENFSEDVVWPMGFGLDPNELYVRAYHEGRYAVFKVNLEDPELARELVLSDPNFDVEGALKYSPKTGEVIGIQYSSGKGLYHFWDEGYNQTLSAIEEAFPDTFNSLISVSSDEKRYLVYSSGDVTPGVYRIVDMEQGGFFTVGQSYPELSDVELMAKNGVNIKARDGLDLRAYLTMPEVVDEAVPAVIFPHGGPIARDDADFDNWTQFFANRGYAVLQVNFRGSSGYGYDFFKAGLKNYGLKMQDDLEDSTHWLIEQGIADPDRICIVGGSYGGYAALMGVAKTPDLYACAVSFAGISDMNKMLSHDLQYSNSDVVKEQYGDDRKQLRQTSPRRLVDSIAVPVLLAHGDKDRSVPVEQSRMMQKAMLKAGKDVTYMEFEKGDHYLSVGDHRMAFFKAMDAFLAEHLAQAE